MKTQTLTALTLLAALLATLWTLPAQAHWPRTVEEDMPIATNPTVQESYPSTMSLNDGRVLVCYVYDGIGNCYQIINRFGDFELPQYTELCPGLPQWVDQGCMRIVSDERGGAFVLWCEGSSGIDSLSGIYGQHLDSLGNRLWGDSGVHIYPRGSLAGFETEVKVCPDGRGGLFLAIAFGELADAESDLWAQHVDSNGNILWGRIGMYVCDLQGPFAARPQIAPDLSGGFYVVWDDNRSGSGTHQLYGQHIDAQGNFLWQYNGLLLLSPNAFRWYKLIPDGTGCVILQEKTEFADYLIHRRINSSGQILWTRDHLSYSLDGNTADDISQGDPGYFYLGYSLYNGSDTTDTAYGQKVDLNGNTHWSPAIFYSRPGWPFSKRTWTYRYPNYYFLVEMSQYPSQRFYLITQYLDPLGNRQMGDYGATLSIYNYPIGEFEELNLVPIEGDIVVFFQIAIGSYNIWAKRCHADGTLGGPFPMGVTVTPDNPPIQIPATGGSFTFDLAIADTDSVGGSYDAWIEVVMPGNRIHPIIARRHLNMPTGATITRPNLTQLVPASAPAGIYTYRVCAGDDSFKIPWGQGSFTFEKVAGGLLLVAGEEKSGSSDSGQAPLGQAGMTTLLSGMTAVENGWTLSGDFFSEGVEVGAHGMRPLDQQGGDSEGARRAPLQGALSELQLEARPNPFNPDVDISFSLLNAEPIELAIYDLRGSKIETLTDGVLPPGLHTYKWNGERHSAGIYFIRLSTESQSVTKKVTLLK